MRARHIVLTAPLTCLALVVSAVATPRAALADDSSSDDGEQRADTDKASTCTPDCKRGCKHSKRCGNEVEWTEASLTSFGIRGNLMSLKLSGVSDTTGSATLATFMSETRTRNLFTGHTYGQGQLGGGSGGFEGQLDLATGWGLRAPIGDEHGPLIRGGLSGLLLGNDQFYVSYLEVPTVWVGYQYLASDGLLIEGGARGGALLNGKYFPGPNRDFHRNINGLDYGAYLLLSLPSVRGVLNAEWLHSVPNTTPGGPFDMVRASACVHAAPVVVCADGRYVRSDVDFRFLTPPAFGSASAEVYYGGISVGIGSFKNKGMFSATPVETVESR